MSWKKLKLQERYTLVTQDSIGHLKTLCMSVLSLAVALESEWKRYSVRVWIQLQSANVWLIQVFSNGSKNLTSSLRPQNDMDNQPIPGRNEAQRSNQVKGNTWKWLPWLELDCGLNSSWGSEQDQHLMAACGPNCTYRPFFLGPLSMNILCKNEKKN